MTVDPIALATVTREAPLLAVAPARPFTCAICDCRQEPHTWRVTLPAGLGRACTGCAGGHGFEVC